MAPKASKASKAQPKAPEPIKDYPNIAALQHANYEKSRPYHKPLPSLSTTEKTHYAYARFLETGIWKTWNEVQQKEFWKYVETYKIPTPLPEPKDLGRDRNGRDIGKYSVKEYEEYQKRERGLEGLIRESTSFKDRQRRLRRSRIPGGEEYLEDLESGIEEERNRRKLIGVLKGKKMGLYEESPEWDDVVPIAQDDGEGALAQIAYTEEYSEAMSYLRAVMSSQEHSPRVLALTSHIISLNPAHYTVWLYRASTLFALDSPLDEEIEWVNDIAVENQKNYQIWHHRQLLIDQLYLSIKDGEANLKDLEHSEREFMTEMFDADAKNYHVWSYRQYLVRKLSLWNQAEIESIETLIRKDVRNNSAWSHRFFVVFNDPEYTTEDSPATAHDPKIPDDILDREIEFAKAATFEAPQNQSPWNYLRGVLRKGGRDLSTLESFATEFVKKGKNGEEDVKSSHALDFLANVWAEKGDVDKAKWALELLGDKYDRIRKGYWDWKAGQLTHQDTSNLEAKVEALNV